MRRAIPAVLSGLVLATAIALMGCTDLGSPPSGEPTPGEHPEQELFDAVIRFYQDDRLQATLHAGRIRKFMKRSTVLLDSQVVMEFYNEQGHRTTLLTSDSGRVDESRRDMIAIGHVVASSDSGQTLETDQLRWENRTRRIISDTHVRLMTSTDTINGIGFVSDEHLKNWRIMQPTGRTFRTLERREPRPFLSPPDAAVADSV